MLLKKTNISARVGITLKKIVEDYSFTHKDAYELGAKLIAMGNAEDKVKAVADYVTDTVDADGIYKALKKLGVL